MFGRYVLCERWHFILSLAIGGPSFLKSGVQGQNFVDVSANDRAMTVVFIAWAVEKRLKSMKLLHVNHFLLFACQLLGIYGIAYVLPAITL